MKILIITDLHSWSDEEINLTKNLYDYEICFLLGDINSSYLEILKSIIKTPIYALNGNHDLNDTVENSGLENIHGKIINFDELIFTGFQGSFRYKNGPFCMYTQKESLDICKTIPKADIFLTHDIMYNGKKKDSHSGLKGITKYIKKHKPRIHIHGHTHINSIDKFKNTTSIGIYKTAIIDTDTLEIRHIY